MSCSAKWMARTSVGVGGTPVVKNLCLRASLAAIFEDSEHFRMRSAVPRHSHWDSGPPISSRWTGAEKAFAVQRDAAWPNRETHYNIMNADCIEVLLKVKSHAADPRRRCARRPWRPQPHLLFFSWGRIAPSEREVRAPSHLPAAPNPMEPPKGHQQMQLPQQRVLTRI